MKRIALAVVMTGCTTMRGRADTAYAHGDFMQAAQLYDKLAIDNPTDGELIARRNQARAGELGRELTDVQAARYARLDAEHTGRLALLLDQRDVWGGVMPDALRPALETEVAAEAAHIAGEATAKLEAAGPLAAEDAVAHYGELVARADFTQQRADLHKLVTDAGQARCSQLAEVAATPYWSMLADRYCAHFGVIREVPQLPEQRTALAFDGAVAGETDDETRALRGALTDAFARTPWFATNGTGTAHAVTDGTVEVGASSREVTLTASWTEVVSYTDYETQSESYQEPYDDTETYTETVNDPDGTSHTEVKTRTVTNYRTAYRDIQVPVTKTRDEPRSQDYPAIERDASYRSRLRLRVDGGLPEITASVAGSDQQHGYDVDVTIGEAGVGPSLANLPTHEQFAAKQHERLAAHFLDLMKGEYVRRFCTQATYTVEEAARCTMAGYDLLPKAARESLGQVLGDETSYLGVVLAN